MAKKATKIEDEMFILTATFVGNVCFLTTVVVFFYKIRKWRGDYETFEAKKKLLSNNSKIDGTIAAKLRDQQKKKKE